ncbi:MAG: hypothetical protein AWU59_2448 [Methanolobus sp. T82-4]|jgi:hypothetical protein|nr:hypothetical protein [Methanolobus zinderi]KXS40663.1 MAG: hypothetical protein AWU59_2448 [Methanolobus sp. T82-4]
MSKFQKRGYERKGEKKNIEFEEKLIQENLDDLKSEGGESTD